MFRIIEKHPLSEKIHYCRIEAPLIARKAKPGQFVVIRLNEQGERIPLTIADYDPREGSITLVFQELGRTTSLLAGFNSGDNLQDVLGPQGNPTEIGAPGNVVVVGGGIGIAPVFPLARELKAAGSKVTAVVGFRSKELIFWEDKMKSVSERLLISTNDGSYGQKGLVTDVLKTLLDKGEKIQKVFAIGPAIMMKAVADFTAPLKIPTIVSLNSLMVCAMGMCGACRVSVGGKTRFTCVDGPDFDAHQVDFPELMSRLNTYKDEEKGAA